MSLVFDEFDETKQSSAQNYKCSTCGAQMEFSPEKQTLFCPHCRSEEKVEFSSDVTERDFSELTAKHNNWDKTVKAIRCENCGAQQVLEKREIATRCPFCGSNNILEQNEINSVKPDTVIPFKIDKENAIQKCLKWVKSRLFAPRYFKKNVSLDTVAGTYNPIWTFDSLTRTTYNGVLGRTVTRTVVVNGKTETRTETQWFPVSGTIDCNFDDLYVPGSERITEKVMNKLKPYDQKLYVKYNNDLLAGFVATNYTLEPLDAWKKAEARMNAHIRQLIINRHNADKVQWLNMAVNHMKKSFKYLMLPVYVAATTFKQKLYNLYINGVHGKVYGKVPVSAPKVSIAVLIGLLVVGGIIALIALL